MFTELLTRAASIATAPHGVDRFLGSVRPTWDGEDGRAIVVGAVRETPDVVTLHLRPGRGWVRGRAGQHVRLGVEVEGRRVTRSFSLASSEHCDDGTVSITVKAHPNGVVGRHLLDRARPGMVVALSAPDGDFTLAEERPSRLLLISGGSGITPVMALLRTLLDEGHPGEITFLHYARTSEDVIFDAELAVIAATHPHVRLHIVTTREPAEGTGLSGRFTPDHLAQVGDLGDVETYACGPVGLVDAVLDHWDGAGLTDRLHVERFALVEPPTLESSRSERQRGQSGWRVGSADVTGTSLLFAASDRTIASDGRTLLVQAEGAGLRPANGCRMGICHTCTRRKVSGTVQDVRNGALSSPGEELVQLCVSTPVSDVVVDL